MNTRSRAPETVLIDGYNVLLALAKREHADPDRFHLAELRAAMIDALALWAGARGVEVRIAWDGGRGLSRAEGAPIAGMASVWLEPPAEADDWIAHEAARFAAARLPLIVVTADRGLRARLPKETRFLETERLADDLDALLADPLTGAHVHGPGGEDDEIPATDGPVDTRRLPRRLTPLLDPPPLGPIAFGPRGNSPSRARTFAAHRKPTEDLVPTAQPTAAEQAARAEAAARREQRRKKFDRAQRRKP